MPSTMMERWIDHVGMTALAIFVVLECNQQTVLLEDEDHHRIQCARQLFSGTVAIGDRFAITIDREDVAKIKAHSTAKDILREMLKDEA